MVEFADIAARVAASAGDRICSRRAMTVTTLPGRSGAPPPTPSHLVRLRNVFRFFASICGHARDTQRQWAKSKLLTMTEKGSTW